MLKVSQIASELKAVQFFHNSFSLGTLIGRPRNDNMSEKWITLSLSLIHPSLNAIPLVIEKALSIFSLSSKCEKKVFPVKIFRFLKSMCSGRSAPPEPFDLAAICKRLHVCECYPCFLTDFTGAWQRWQQHAGGYGR